MLLGYLRLHSCSHVLALLLALACSKENTNSRSVGSSEGGNDSNLESSDHQNILVGPFDVRAPLQLLPDQQYMLKSILPDSFPMGLNRVLKEYMNLWYPLTAKEVSPTNLLGSFTWLVGSTKMLLQENPPCVVPEALYSWSKTYDQPAYIVCRNPIQSVPEACKVSPHCRAEDLVCVVGCSKGSSDPFPNLVGTADSLSLTGGSNGSAKNPCSSSGWVTGSSDTATNIRRFCSSQNSKDREFCWVPDGTISVQQDIPYWEAVAIGYPFQVGLGNTSEVKTGFFKKGRCVSVSYSDAPVIISNDTSPVPPSPQAVPQDVSTSQTSWAPSRNSATTKNMAESASSAFDVALQQKIDAKGLPGTGGIKPSPSQSTDTGGIKPSPSQSTDTGGIKPMPSQSPGTGSNQSGGGSSPFGCSMEILCDGKPTVITGTVNASGGCDIFSPNSSNPCPSGGGETPTPIASPTSSPTGIPAPTSTSVANASPNCDAPIVDYFGESVCVPVLSVAGVTGLSVSLTWTNPHAENDNKRNAFTICRSEVKYPGGCFPVANISPTETSYTDRSDLQPGVTYYYYIMIRGIGGDSNIVSATTQAPPTGFRSCNATVTYECPAPYYWTLTRQIETVAPESQADCTLSPGVQATETEKFAMDAQAGGLCEVSCNLVGRCALPRTYSVSIPGTVEGNAPRRCVVADFESKVEAACSKLPLPSQN